MQKNLLPKRKESEIQLAVCKYLKAKGHFFWRSNNVPIFDPKAKRYRAMGKYALPGVADIILVSDGIIFGLEIKSSTGKLSKAQADFAKELTYHGGIYKVCRSIDDVIALGL